MPRSLQTVEVSAKFVNGKPDRIEAFYIMKSAMQWDRFMRFMEHYAEDHGLNFNKVPHCLDSWAAVLWGMCGQCHLAWQALQAASRAGAMHASKTMLAW